MSPKDDTGPIRGIPLEKATLPLTLVLSAALAVAMSLGAWFYSGLVSGVRDVASEVRAVRDQITTLERRVAVLEAPALDSRVRDLQQRMAVLEERIKAGAGGGR